MSLGEMGEVLAALRHLLIAPRHPGRQPQNAFVQPESGRLDPSILLGSYGPASVEAAGYERAGCLTVHLELVALFEIDNLLPPFVRA